MKHCNGAIAKKGHERTYEVWLSMRRRCDNKNNRAYPYYGGRGISVCAEWNNFANFLNDMGDIQDGLSLDRIDNDGNYCKANCRWSTRAEQNRNTRRSRYYTYDGITLCARDWEIRLGLSVGALWHRLKSGWDIKTALATKNMIMEQK